MKAENDFSAGILLCRWLVAAAVLCFPLIGQAAKFDRYTDFQYAVGNNTVTAFPAPGAPGANLSGWAQGTKTPTATGPTWTSNGKSLPFNPSPTANFKAKFTPTNMAKALMSPTTILTWAAASALSRLMTEACVRVAGGSMQIAPGGAWEECVFETQTRTDYRWTTSGGSYGNGSTWQTSFSAACAQIQPYYDASFQGGWGADFTGSTFTCSPNNTPKWTYCANHRTAGACASSASGGMATQQASGLVNTGEFKPISNTGAETKMKEIMDQWTQADFLYGYTPGDGKGLDELLDSIMDSGNSVEGEVIAPQIQTPITEAPVTTTTTNPDGSKKVETEVTTNDYSCLVIQNGAAVECKQAKTTTKTTATTTNPNGSGTVTTTATSVTSQQTKPGEQVDQCAKYPDSLGCSKVAVETGDPIPKVTKTLTYTAETVLGGGSCPADKFMSIRGQQIKVWNWVQACDYIVTFVKPLFLAVAAFVALIIIMPGGTAVRGVDG